MEINANIPAVCAIQFKTSFMKSQKGFLTKTGPLSVNSATAENKHACTPKQDDGVVQEIKRR